MALFKSKKISELPPLGETTVETLIAGQKGQRTGALTVKSILDLASDFGNTKLVSASVQQVQDGYEVTLAQSDLTEVSFIIPIDSSPVTADDVMVCTMNTLNFSQESDPFSGESTTILASPSVSAFGLDLIFTNGGTYNIEVSYTIESNGGGTWPLSSTPGFRVQHTFASTVPDYPAVYLNRLNLMPDNHPSAGSYDFIATINQNDVVNNPKLSLESFVLFVDDDEEFGDLVFNTTFVVTVKRLAD